MSADDSNRSIIIVLGKSERQVVEFGVQNLMKIKILVGGKKLYFPQWKHLYWGKKKKVQLTALTLSCNRNNTCAC